MPEDLDELLRDYASRWRAGLDETEAHERLSGPGRPRRWPVLLAAAAVVLVVVAASLLATSRQTGQPMPTGQPTPSGLPSPSATPSPDLAGVVPWLPLPPTHPTLPVRTIPARPLPGAAADLPACTQDQVRTSSGEDGAGGSMMRWIELRLAGDQPCRLAPGYPTVVPVFRGTSVHLPVMHVHEHGHWPATAPVPLTKGHPALVPIWWQYSAYCGPSFDMPSLRVTVPGLAPLTITGFGKRQCASGDPGHAAPPLQLWPTAPQTYHPVRTESLWRHVRASGDLRLTARPGSLVRFTVTLTSKHDLVLDPCPDYQMLLAGSGLAPQQPSYALNCAAVPYHDSTGRPVLPADTPVTFAMQVRAPQQSATKFIWSLGPQTLGVAAGGQLTVAATGPLQAPTCEAGDLRPTASLGAAGGTAYLRVDLHLDSSQPCRLDGFPEVQALSQGKEMPVEVRQGPSTTWGWTGGSFLVRRGQPAVEEIAWPVGHYCGPQLDVDHIAIVLPGDSTPMVVQGFGKTMCNPGEGHPPIVVSPLAPWSSLPHRN